MTEIWKIPFITLFKQPLHRGSVPPPCFKPILLQSHGLTAAVHFNSYTLWLNMRKMEPLFWPQKGFIHQSCQGNLLDCQDEASNKKSQLHAFSLWHLKFDTWVLAEMREQRSLPWEPHFLYMVTGNIFCNVMQLTHFRTIHARAGLPHKRQTYTLLGSCLSRWTTTLPKLFTGLAWSSKQSHFAEGALSLWAQATNFPFLF